MIPYHMKHINRMLAHFRDDLHVTRQFGVAGYFKLDVHKVDKDDNIISTKEGEWFKNLITNQGMNFIGHCPSTNRMFMGCQVGKGSTPPAFADVQLGTNFVVGTTTQQTATTTAQVVTVPYYVSNRITWRFAAGTVAAAGGIITEVAIVGDCTDVAARTSNTAPLFSHAQIKDGTGTPTTLTILSDEVLDVTYEFRMYPLLSGTGTFNMTIDGVSTAFNYEVRPCKMSDQTFFWPLAPANWNSMTARVGSSNYNIYGGTSAFDIGDHVNMPNQATSDNWESVTNAVYIANNWYRDFTFFMGLNKSNFNIKAMVFSFNPGFCFQMNLNNTVNKIASKKFEINVRVAWTRYP